MTTRLKYPYVWAVDGVVADPDLDTTAPPFKPNRYENIGWEVQKPPEEWQNFLSQISDIKIVEMLVNGVLQWDSSVTYPIGAIASVGGVLYAKVVNKATAVSPELADSGWLVASAMKASEYEELMAWIAAHLQDHLQNFNPHADTMAGLVGGGYEKEETMKFFLDDADPRTIGYHKLQMGAAVHGTTCEQLNILPKSGGTFPELITFLGCVLLEGGSKMCFNKSTARLELNLGNTTLSIDTNGDAWVTKGEITSWVMTVANYPQMQIRAGFAFALPLPFVRVNLETSINDLEGIGWDYLTTDNEVVFDGGLVLDPTGKKDVRINKTLGSDGKNTTLFVRYTNTANTVVTRMADYGPTLAEPTNVYGFLKTIFGITDAKSIRQIEFYQRLTPYQKSMLEQ